MQTPMSHCSITVSQTKANKALVHVRRALPVQNLMYVLCTYSINMHLHAEINKE